MSKEFKSMLKKCLVVIVVLMLVAIGVAIASVTDVIPHQVAIIIVTLIATGISAMGILLISKAQTTNKKD